MGQVTFLRDCGTPDARNGPWPERRPPLLLHDPLPPRWLPPWPAVIAASLLATFVAGYTYGVIVTRRAVVVEAEVLR